MMHAPRLCTTVSSQNNWKKYFYGICLLIFLYVIIVMIHNGEQIRILTEKIKHIKEQLSDNVDIDTRLYKMEITLHNIKREQEYFKRKLKTIVSKELEKYSWDKTGRTDFALEASGGRIVRLSRDTENFDGAKSILGITLCEGFHGPRAMLQADMSPGHCWAIKGSSGGAIIKLLGKIKINAVTIEHIPVTMSPTLDNKSAPKDFEVWGLKDVMDKGEYIGRFTYRLNGQFIQTFDINNPNFYNFVEFRVLTNYNNPDFTCVYRFRVHGVLEK